MGFWSDPSVSLEWSLGGHLSEGKYIYSYKLGHAQYWTIISQKSRVKNVFLILCRICTSFIPDIFEFFVEFVRMPGTSLYIYNDTFFFLLIIELLSVDAVLLKHKIVKILRFFNFLFMYGCGVG